MDRFRCGASWSTGFTSQADFNQVAQSPTRAVHKSSSFYIAVLSNEQLRTSHLTVTWAHFETAGIIFRGTFTSLVSEEQRQRNNSV